MKGLVFTTFYDFVERRFGAEMLDDIIDDARLPHGGAYTSVGTYPFDEMVALITALVKRTDLPMPIAMNQFGEHCFGNWVGKFPALFEGRDLFDVLAHIDEFHASEVLKLYPDAELPSFEVSARGPDHIVLDYRSCKPLADLAVGVIHGAAKHLGTVIDVTYSPVADAMRFRVERVGTNRLAA